MSLLCIEDPGYPMELEVREKLTDRTLGDVIINLKDPKSVKL